LWVAADESTDKGRNINEKTKLIWFFRENYLFLYMSLSEAYKIWCKETKRNGAVLIGSSIQEFFTWYETKFKPK